MELNKVNDLLKDIALAKKPVGADKALRNIALALMHMAKDIDDLHRPMYKGD